MNRVFILGLDGARLDLVEKWANQGYLPNFKNMIENGVSSDLETVFPPHSFIGWPSFVTGCNPGKHGVHNVVIQKPGSYEFYVPNSRTIKKPMIFDILTEKGLTSASINLPLSYPPKKIKGLMISSWLAPPMAKIAYPEEAMSFLRKIKYQASGENVYETLEKKIKVLEWFMEKNREWKLICFVLTETEQLHHKYAFFLDDRHPYYKKDYERIVRELYIKIDSLLGELTDKLKDTAFFIISDHGFAPSYGTIYLNNVLANYGLFKKKITAKTIKAKLIHKLKGRGWRKLFAKLGISNLDLLPSFMKRALQSPTYAVDCNWRETRAYCTAALSDIRINLKGREPQGIVERSEYKRFRERIAELIMNDSEIGRYVNKIYYKEELYSGELENISDIYIDFKKCITSSPETPANIVFSQENLQGYHTMNGIFIAYGEEIKKGEKIGKVSIMDIAPTVLHILGLQIPDYFDGVVKKEIFEEKSNIYKRKINYEKTEKRELLREKIKKMKKSYNL